MRKERKEYYCNRELSWLKFNERVLEEAADTRVPLCERLSFVSIFQSNLDEFFMVRVGTLYDQMLLKTEVLENKTYMSSEEQIEAILAESDRLGRKRDEVYQEIMEELGEHGVRLCLYDDLSREGKRQAEYYFEHEVQPLLSPTIVGRKQPFPFLKNGEIYAVVVIETARSHAKGVFGREKIGIIPCGSQIGERLIPIPAMPGCFILREELILHFASRIFDHYDLAEKSLVKITRSADINTDAMEESEADYRDAMADIIKSRKKLAPVRLEMTRELNSRVVEALCYQLGIEWEQVFQCNTPLDMGFVGEIRDTLREDSALFFPRFVPAWPEALTRNRSIMEQVEEKDVLLSYPYESIRPFLKLLHEAANDESVVSIKMTLYRLAKQSKVVEALVEAAENGKEVVVLVELKARFDEENNIEWSRQLEEAGCRVVYGVDELKVHSKLCLITRRRPDRIEYITQIGTGNYNEKTAALYTDLSLMTADRAIGQDAAAVFNALCMGEVVKETEELLVAPLGLQSKLIDLIREETAEAQAGRESYIGVKVNSMTDKKLMEELVKASQAGVRIDLIVRGACCLIPGVQGYTENIRVISIVGRFLEHSRIYLFGKGERERIWISSADWMTRNTLRRVEVAAPVKDEARKKEIHEMFEIMLSDNRKARELQPDGTYVRVEEKSGDLMDSQQYFCGKAQEGKVK